MTADPQIPTIVFDVDGTLIGSEQLDWNCFSEAILEVTGFQTHPEFWDSLTEVTSAAILNRILRDRPCEERIELSGRVHEMFDSKLAAAIRLESEIFSPVSGIQEIVDMLNAGNRFKTALATGEWRAPIERKLRASGLKIQHWPLVSSNEREQRHEAIRHAIKLAGGSVENALYIGDGTWDFEASRRLGIPFIGVGSKVERLRSMGATTLDSFAPETFEYAVREALEISLR